MPRRYSLAVCAYSDGTRPLKCVRRELADTHKSASTRNPFSIPIVWAIRCMGRRFLVSRIAVANNLVLSVCAVTGE